MPVYSKKIMIPHNTPINNPVEMKFNIRERKITYVEWMIDIATTAIAVGISIIGVDKKGQFPIFTIPIDAEDYLWKSGQYNGQIILPERDFEVVVKCHSQGTHNSHPIIVIIHTK